MIGSTSIQQQVLRSAPPMGMLMAENKAVRTQDLPDLAGAGERPARVGDPYRAVLEDLHRKRQELDAAISAIEQIIAESGSGERVASSVTHRRPKRPQPRVAEAVKSVLESLGRPVRNAEIKSALIASGYRFTAGDPDVSIVQALNRLSAANAVVKLGRGLWAKRT